MKYVYTFLNYVFMKIRLWIHKDVFNYENVWSAITMTGDLKDAQKTYLNRSDDTKMPKTDKVKVRHDTIEKQLSDRQKCLDIAKEKNDKESIELWTAMLQKEIQDIWWWNGIRYQERSIIDKVRRYFALSCGCRTEIEWDNRSYLSRNWFAICQFFEDLENYFYYKIDS